VSILKNGIEHYVKSLSGPKHLIFGNIEGIHDFHANHFCPALKACGEDVIKIAKTFEHFISNDFFYGYVLFMLSRARSQEIYDENIDLFQVGLLLKLFFPRFAVQQSTKYSIFD
jgi:hypothetical protein